MCLTKAANKMKIIKALSLTCYYVVLLCGGFTPAVSYH